MLRMWSGIALLGVMGCAGHRPPEVASSPKVYHPPPLGQPVRTVTEGQDPVISVEPPEIAVPAVPAVPVPEKNEVIEVLEAQPRLPLPARVAVFALDEDLARQVADGLVGLQGIADTYVVRNYLLDGRSRWSSPFPYASHYHPPLDVDLVELRQLAAMAHCDALLMVDHAYQQYVNPNGWTVLSPLLLPMLFTPWLNTEEKSYLDVHLIDVRTGYLYGQVTADQDGRRGPITIYKADVDEVIDAQLEVEIGQVRDEISDLLWWHLMPGANASAP